MIPTDYFETEIVNIGVAINRACWNLRQNQGVEGATPLNVLLPEKVQITAEIAVTDAGAKVTSVTASSADDPSTTTTTAVNGESRVTRDSEGTSNSTSSEESTTQGTTDTGRGGRDTRVEQYTYDI